jgi:hypothetical protein
MNTLQPRYLTTRCMPSALSGTGLSIAKHFWRWLWRPMMIERQQRKLNVLSDHILKDIGLSRADIDSIAVHLVDGRVDLTRRHRPRTPVR